MNSISRASPNCEIVAAFGKFGGARTTISSGSAGRAVSGLVSALVRGVAEGLVAVARELEMGDKQHSIYVYDSG